MTDLTIRKMDNEMCSVYYNSLYDFHTEKRMDNNKSNHIGTNRHLERKADPSWFGVEYQQGKDVIKKALLGDPILYKNLQEKISLLDKRLGTFTAKGVMQSVVKSKRVTVRGKFGDEIDIHKINSGQLDTAWSSKIRKQFDAQHKLVTLFIDISGNSNIKCEDTLWTAAVTVKLLADLERAGKSVKIVVGGAVYSALRGTSKKLACAITVKEYNERLAPERLAAMSHVGFYRSWGFTAYHDHDYATVTDTIGYSRGTMTVKELPINLQEEIEKGHTRLIVVPKSLNSYDAETSIKECKRQIESFAN